MIPPRPQFRSFHSTVNPFRPSDWHRTLKLLVDGNNYPVGVQNTSGWADGLWVPVDLTADQLAAPSPEMVADLNTVFRLNVAPYTRYVSDGTTLVPVNGIGGALNYTATGGTVVRSAQDRAADVANVLDFGADPTGVLDSSVALNAAAAIVAAGSTRHKAVYLPTGTYRINHQINLTACQSLYGDNRGSSTLMVDQAFSSTDTAVIFVSAASYDAGPVLRDFGITFAQPTTQGTRANFLTIAAGGTSGSGGTGVQYPWAIAAGNDSFRIQCVRLRIGGAWNGITTNNHNAIFQLEDIEMGALNVGLSLGRGTAVLDQTHINNYHFWNFELGGSLFNVFSDGQNTAMLVGNSTLAITGLEIFCGRVIFNDDTGNNDSSIHIAHCQLDGDPSSLEVIGSLNHLWISNMYGSAGTARVRPFVTVTGNARVNISNYYSHSSSSYPDFLIDNPFADVSLTNFFANYFTTGVNWITFHNGFLRVTNGYLNMASPRTVPAIAETATGVLLLDNVWFQGGPGSGPLLTVTNVHPWTNIGCLGLETGNGWTFSLPAGLSQTDYSPTMILKGSLFTDGGIQAGTAGGGSVNSGLVSAAGNQRANLFFSGVALRWAVLTDGTAESGANAGSNFAIGRWNDAGVFQGSPISINRATGLISLGTTQVGNATTVADLEVVGPAGTQKNVYLYRGANIAWAMSSRDATDDFAVLRFNDSGGFLANSFLINRATGRPSFPEMPASTTFANDGAAAAGGVAVGQLYRNGSVIQIRVT